MKVKRKLMLIKVKGSRKDVVRRQKAIIDHIYRQDKRGTDKNIKSVMIDYSKTSLEGGLLTKSEHRENERLLNG